MARAGRKASRHTTRKDQSTPGGDNHTPLEQTELLGIPKKHWAIARRRMRLVKIALGSKIRGMSRYDAVARKAGVSPRALYRWAAKWQRDRTLTALLPGKLGPRRGLRRLGHDREIIVDAVLDEWMTKRETLPIAAAHEEVNRRCSKAGIKPVSRGAVEARLRARKKPGRRRRAGQPADIPATRRALGIVQVDHTPVDVMVVEEGTRRSIGRPWITVVFDIATRAVLGFHVSLEAPSATSVAMALGMACLPKYNWLYKVNAGVEWPMHGIPEALHLDNAKEFYSEALRRGCERHDIRLMYRAPGRPYTGGHIERYLGTLMTRIHGLPGTTGSNPKDRGSYQSEKRAALTMAELETWLTLEIAGRYHQTVHKGIHMTPAAAWRAAVERQAVRTSMKPKELAIDFLPVIARKVGRSGFQIFHIRYWDPTLSRVFQSPERTWIRFNPRNLSRVFVAIPRQDAYLSIPYADLRRPPVSLSEQQAAVREIAERGRRTVNEDAVFTTIEAQRELVDKALTKTRNRRKVARRPTTTDTPAGVPGVARKGTSKSVATTTADFSKPAKPSPGETWTHDRAS
jgi:putative transposase